MSTITLVILLSHELEQRLAREAAGIELVVGAKGSPLQLVLAIEQRMLLATSGLRVGLGIAHALAATIGTWLSAAGELASGVRAWQAEEWGVVALALGAGIIATLIPAWRAYRQGRRRHARRRVKP